MLDVPIRLAALRCLAMGAPVQPPRAGFAADYVIVAVITGQALAIKNRETVPAAWQALGFELLDSIGWISNPASLVAALAEIQRAAGEAIALGDTEVFRF